jgi:hypothetical protein
METFVTLVKAQRDIDNIRSFKRYIVVPDVQTFCPCFTGDKNRLHCKEKCIGVL